MTDGVWQHAGSLSEFMPAADDETVMAVVSPADVRCSWFSLQGLEARQAEGVAKLRAAEQSLGLVHASAAQHVGDDYVTATIAPEVMQYGLDRLAARGVNPADKRLRHCRWLAGSACRVERSSNRASHVSGGGGR